MKRRHVFLLVFFSMTLAVFLGACNLLGTDMMDRVNTFAAGLNNPDRSTINANFDQSLTQNLSSMTPTWWASNFPVPPDANHLYSISLIDYSNPSNVVATMMGPSAFNGGTGLPISAVFVLSFEGTDWYIEKVYLNGCSTPIIQ
jgi:hypothetical protein